MTGTVADQRCGVANRIRSQLFRPDCFIVFGAGESRQRRAIVGHRTRTPHAAEDTSERDCLSSLLMPPVDVSLTVTDVYDDRIFADVVVTPQIPGKSPQESKVIAVRSKPRA